VHRPVVVAQAHVAKRDVLHQAGDVGDLDDVTGADLVFEEDEEAREVVLHQRLRTEAHGQTHHARGAQDRR
jgi:nitrate reductase NapAB chaperone NapD